MEILKTIFLSKVAKRFYWTTLAGFLGVLTVELASADLSSMPPMFVIALPIIISIISGITKEINNNISK